MCFLLCTQKNKMYLPFCYKKNENCNKYRPVKGTLQKTLKVWNWASAASFTSSVGQPEGELVLLVPCSAGTPLVLAPNIVQAMHIVDWTAY